MPLAQALSTCLRKYADFGGRASRPEYWWWALALGVVSLIVILFDAQVGSIVYGSAWGLIALLPTLAVSVRRLRDAGLPWAWLLLLLVPLLGTLVVFALLAMPTAADRGVRTS